MFSSCSKYVVGYDHLHRNLLVWKCNTMRRLDIERRIPNLLDVQHVGIDNYQLISQPYSSDIDISKCIYCLTLPTGKTVWLHECHFLGHFLWKSRNCCIPTNLTSFLILRDIESGDVVDTIDVGRLPSSISVSAFLKCDGKHLIISLNRRLILCMSIETLAQTSLNHEFRFSGKDVLQSCTMSPNNSFILCCYSSRLLSVRNVDSGETLQTFQFNQPPKACFWSENYLWVACTEEVVTFPYQLSEQNVLGNDVVECFLDCLSVLAFAAGILVANTPQKKYICLRFLAVNSVFKK